MCLMKDKRETEEKAGIVYRLDCSERNACYVGESGRLLRERREELMKGVNEKHEKSNVYHHVRKTGHSIDYQEIKVLDKK